MGGEGGFDDNLFAGDAPRGPRFTVDVKGYEGPLDALLSLAREQKVDLVHVSILELADQYLAWVAEARRSNLELAADYLVMAAWLAFLKSRLLLPDTREEEEEPSGEEMAAALAFQLRRLEAMQDAGQALMERPRLGRDFFARGCPERFRPVETAVYDVSLYDLLKAYGDQRRRLDHRTMRIEPLDLHSVDDALKRLEAMLGTMPSWEALVRFLPEDLRDGLAVRSATAATFIAALEMVREGRLQVRQNGTFGPIYLRRASRSEGGEDNGEGGEDT